MALQVDLEFLICYSDYISLTIPFSVTCCVFIFKCASVPFATLSRFLIGEHVSRRPVSKSYKVDNIMATLSDAGRYAYASLFALTMSYDDYDRNFRQETMRCLLQHLNLIKASARKSEKA